MTGERDYLFINYATEDGDLARWLTIKLTAAGYKVWCDQVRLLGGESYPRDIDRAIRDQTFRMLSLISRASVNKPNPLKERTLGVNLSNQRGLEFVLPVRVDDIAPTELNFHIADLTFIDFSAGWADGYRRLRRKLEAIGAPRPLANGPEVVSQWFDRDTAVVRRPERLWANVLEFFELPGKVFRVQAAGTNALPWPEDWPRVPHGLASFVFEVPPFPSGSAAAFAFDWHGEPPEPGLRPRDVVTNLLRQYVREHARRRGLFMLEDGSLYFPRGFLEENRLAYQDPQDRHHWTLVAGDRVFRLGNDRRETVRYHLAFRARPDLYVGFGRPVLRIAVTLYLTEVSGKPLETRRAHGRRRRMCKRWYNEEWLKRVIAIGSYLADGEASVNLAFGPATRIILAGRPLELEAPVGIDEARLGKVTNESILLSAADDGEEEGVGIA